MIKSGNKDKNEMQLHVTRPINKWKGSQIAAILNLFLVYLMSSTLVHVFQKKDCDPKKKESPFPPEIHDNLS